MASTVVQLGGVVVLAGLFVLLRRFVLRRAYFSAWASAWIALTVALCAIVARYNVLPAVAGGPLPEDDPGVRLVYYVYQVAKLAVFVWFVHGTLMYVAGRRQMGRSRVLWIAVSGYAVASVALSRHQAMVVVLQAPLAVAALGYCGAMLLLLPRARRTAGTISAGSGFAFLALLWTTYAFVFGLYAFRQASLPSFAWFIIEANAYLDLAGSIALGYGMILILMEDSKREVDDAQAALRAAHDGLRRAALYDPLTGVMNRSAFTEGLGLDMARASYGTVVLLDLDNLKEVNDEFGHAWGDMLLRACADTLRGALRQTDRLYRWGGDEFLLVLPMARAGDVQRRFEDVIAATPLLYPGGLEKGVQLAASVGAADFASYDDLRAAIVRADALMYKQKHARKRAAAEATGRRVTPFGTPALPR